jgi:hypothetical protein
MESWLVPWSLIEKFDGVGEREIWIRRAQRGKAGQAGIAFDVDAFFNQHGRGACGLQQREVAAVSEKGDLAWLGMFYPGNAVDGDLTGAIKTAAELLGNVGKFHGHKDGSLQLGASLAQRDEGSTAGCVIR